MNKIDKRFLTGFAVLFTMCIIWAATLWVRYEPSDYDCKCMVCIQEQGDE
jgi:hypothetical protein